jgi:hypothetical protein
MHTISSITDLILELEKSGHLDLKVSEYNLSVLINRHFTGQEIYKKDNS